MQQKGDWLGIGGHTMDGWGKGRIEVRVANDHVGWDWRDLTDEERAEIMRHMSEWSRRKQSLTTP